jgi:isopenicillin N synthase-like dioxygenase
MNTKTLSEKLLISLLENGIVFLPISSSFLTLIKELDAHWVEFLSQDDSHKQIHVFEDGMGYEYRSPDEPDYKETFHIRPGYQLPKKHSEADVRFVQTAKIVLIELIPIVANFAESLSDLAQRDMKAFVTTHVEQWILRSLNYPPRTTEQIENKDTILADGHVDKCLTFGLTETAPGLEILSIKDKQWVPVKHKEGYLHGYAGLLGQYYTNCEVKALCHQVVTTPVTERDGRRSHVSFIDFGAVQYNKAKYGRTQNNFAHGENYDMPCEQYNQYFIETT